jgi:hypothetical protein
MPLAPEDYKIDKALQGVNLDDPPYVRRCVLRACV